MDISTSTPGEETVRDIDMIPTSSADEEPIIATGWDDDTIQAPLLCPGESCMRSIHDVAEMLALINSNTDDAEFIIMAIRDSAIDYTIHQRQLIRDVEAAFDDGIRDCTRSTRHLNDCIMNLVHALETEEYDEAPRDESAKSMSEETKRFCKRQKELYLTVYEAIAGSALPYSHDSRILLGGIRENIDRAIGHPDAYGDMRLESDLRAFFHSLARDDFTTTRERIVIYSTLDHHAKLIVNQIKRAEEEEQARTIPFKKPKDSLVNLATYATAQLTTIFHLDWAEDSRATLFAGYREIYSKAIIIFMDSHLDLTRYQHSLVRAICRATSTFNGDPESEEHEMLKIQFLSFIDQIRHEHRGREVITTSTATMIDPYGPVSQAVDYITVRLHELNRMATNHFLSFKVRPAIQPDLLPSVLRHFLRTYPSRYSNPPLKISAKQWGSLHTY